MKKLRLYLVLFGLLISLPLAFVAWRTYVALDREARGQVRFFADQLLDEMEGELADLVRREEDRAVDEYRHTMLPATGPAVSPLAEVPAEPFILGYFQNNPDGSFQTPLVENPAEAPAAVVDRVAQLEMVNRHFNQRKRGVPPPSPVAEIGSAPAAPEKKEQTAFADRFLKSIDRKKSKSVLGQEQTRVEEISAGQAMNLARQAPELPPAQKAADAAADREAESAGTLDYTRRSGSPATASETDSGRQAAMPAMAPGDRYQVEVAPLQAVTVDADQVFIFRRIDINGRIYRQGFVLRLQPFLEHLLHTHYDPQPIARYTQLRLSAAGLTASRDRNGADAPPVRAARVAARTFPAPFGFLSAEMAVVTLPPSPARGTLTLALTILVIVMVAGLVAIYHSARSVLDLSERRSRFVSAVTHELKTPLTNIRMYIEMLEQGIAATPEREHEYLGILASESARLSGLINNVLELSRLEKRTRRFDLRDGDLSDVLSDVRSLMSESLAREGFDLTVDSAGLPVFAYDREVLVQVLINLMENSIKFGRHLPEKTIIISARRVDEWVHLAVTDTGPGIPKRSLRRVFDDFYRVDNDLTRTIGGTGIGLALVKKFVLAMGGRVQAENNARCGCTITLSLPAKRQFDT